MVVEGAKPPQLINKNHQILLTVSVAALMTLAPAVGGLRGEVHSDYLSVEVEVVVVVEVLVVLVVVVVVLVVVVVVVVVGAKPTPSINKNH